MCPLLNPSLEYKVLIVVIQIFFSLPQVKHTKRAISTHSSKHVPASCKRNIIYLFIMSNQLFFLSSRLFDTSTNYFFFELLRMCDQENALLIRLNSSAFMALKLPRKRTPHIYTTHIDIPNSTCCVNTTRSNDRRINFIPIKRCQRCTVFSIKKKNNNIKKIYFKKIIIIKIQIRKMKIKKTL